VQVGQHYWYAVTAVDRSGNESAPSLAIAVEVAQPSH
jgi:chitodextrinase